MVLCLFNLSVARNQRLCNIWLQECTLPWLNRPQIGNDHLSTQPTHHWLHQQKCKTTLASSRWFCVGGAFHASTLPWHTVWNMSLTTTQDCLPSSKTRWIEKLLKKRTNIIKVYNSVDEPVSEMCPVQNSFSRHFIPREIFLRHMLMSTAVRVGGGLVKSLYSRQWSDLDRICTSP